MAIKGATEALVAAFTFGLVLYAATAALPLYAKGHGTAILRDGQRLVLVGFLSTAALWALTSFISILLHVDNSSMPCQVGIIFATVFDQLARFSIEQYLYWAQNMGEKVSAVHIIPQLLILGRLVAGGVFVGFTRPQTDSFCVAASSQLPISIVVISLDAAILLCLITRALVQNTTFHTDSQAIRRKALFWVMLGLAVWIATSVTLHLGFRYVALVARTAVPAIGLNVLIIILTLCSGTLGSASIVRVKSPEAMSPRLVEISRDISSSESYFPDGNANYQDVKDAAIRSETTFINPREAPATNNSRPTYGLPAISLPITGVAGMGGVPIQGQLFPPIRSNTAPTLPRTRSVKAAVGLHKKGASAGGKLQISNPVLQDTGKNPLDKIPTVDLEDAMRAERERREKLLRQTSLARREMTAQDPREGVNRALSVKRKEVGSPLSSGSSLRPDSMGTSSSTQLSPETGGIRQRSPRQSPELSVLSRQSIFRSVSPPKDFEPLPNLDIRPSRQLPPSPPTPPQERPLTALQRRPTTGLPSNPRARALKLEQDAPGPERQQTVLFFNNVIFDDPALVHETLQGSNNKIVDKPQSPGTPESVVHRPRPIPRKVADPNPFAIPGSGHRRSKSSGSLVKKSMTRSMTVTEKIALMYPGEVPNKLPAVPEVPVARSYLQSPSSVDSEEVQQPTQPTKTTVKTENAPTFVEEPRKAPEYKYDTDMAAKRASSPVLPVNSVQRESMYSEGSQSPDEADTTWNSVRSTQVSVGLAVARPLPRPVVKTVREDIDTKTHLDVAPASQQPAKETKRPEFNTAVDNKPAPKPTSPVQARRIETRSWYRPSSPLESPEHALRQIQEQLKKFEEPVTKACPKDHTERLALLEDLEKEMGVHENHWQEMKHDMGRDSLCSMQTNSPANRNSRCDSTVGSIVIGHGPAVGAMAAERRASRQNMLRNSGSHNPSRLSRDAVKSHMSIWQKRLTEAHIDYMETAAERLRHPSANYLPMPMPNVQLGSPTPPDSDASGDDDSVLSAQLDAVSNWLSKKAVKTVSLWAPVPEQTIVAATLLWTPVPKASPTSMIATPEAETFVRPLARKELPPLEITSTQLWSKPTVNVKQTPTLWTPPASVKVAQTNALWVHVPKTASECPTPLPEADAFVRAATRKVLAPLEITSTHLWKKAEPEKKPSLWTPPPKVSAVTTNRLWSPLPKVLEALSLVADFPEIFTRPAARKELAPLQIFSKHLWRKPYTSTKDTTGLWRPSWASVAPPADFKRLSLQEIPQPKRQKAPRPVTQRPPRRNKRVSALPDILENPQPLPDKRGTLGIFQFPWGEKSDTATMPLPRPFGRSMPGTMSSGVPLRASYTPDYSGTSFFDDYDDEDPESDYEREESDDEDEFDETTLWEIASLLNSDAVPSRNSLFLSATPAYSVDEYYGGGGGGSNHQEQSASASATDIDDDDDNDDDDTSSEHEILIGLGEDPHDGEEHVAEQYDHQGFLVQDTAGSTPSTLDQGAQAVVATRAALADNSASAPAPPRVETSENQAVETRLQISTGLWSRAESPENKTLSLPRAAETTKGLFVLGCRESTLSDNRTTEQQPAAVNMHRKPRATAADSWRPLDKLMSNSLWTPEEAAAKGVSRQVFQHWLTLGLAAKAETDKASASASAVRLSRPQATPAEWDAALKEALIASGYPLNIKCRTETGRITATSADWAAALEEAIQASIIKAIVPAFNSAIRHPVFAGSSLITTSEWFHPAATGYTYDVACVHPIFFGSLAITCPEESVHPAMSAYAHKKLRRHRRSGSSASKSHFRSASTSSTASRKHSRSHSSSSGKKRRESIIAQIHAIEAEMGLIPEDSVVVPEVPSLDEIEASRKAKIQAQIEALEQEKSFAAQMARESFVTRRRASSSVSRATTASGTTNSESDGPASMDSFPLSLSSQRPSTATSVDLEHDVDLDQEDKSIDIPEVPEIPELTVSSPEPTNNGLWTAPSPLPQPIPSPVPTLWTPPASPASSFESYEEALPSPKFLWQPKPGKPEIIAKTDEDREAHERRALGRKGLLMKQRKAEILEQIKALESGDIEGVKEKFKKQGLWTKKSEVVKTEKDWSVTHSSGELSP
ncbi:unnamed protein product [Sordaria macrospora k-hell]|uniref:WGS project CABT00000000 data, contig 2.16 n=1 Tax=Sordaria macrospora (strain ATCC MYA-333 / DSM 997 / K(L3346) / K-hell) TaxID=771870 RepID=F7W057_SORMK|nr:uncharacterized protein SMAC_03862 [Sordaria macrospora k-hell]CCC11156.1 unnamed protein product [Sordaria macrospora k-hell]